MARFVFGGLVLALWGLATCGPSNVDPDPAPQSPTVPPPVVHNKAGGEPQATRFVVYGSPDPGAQALALALGSQLFPWPGRWRQEAPGVVALLWAPEAAPPGALERPPFGGDRVIIGPATAGQQATKFGIGWIDPQQELARRGALPQSGDLLGIVAAQQAANYWSLPWKGPAMGTPVTELNLSFLLGLPASPSTDPRARAANPDPADPSEVVRIRAARDPAKAARLSADPDPWVRARAADNLTDPLTLASLLDDPSSLVRVVAADHLVKLARAGDAAAVSGLRKAAHAPDAYLRWKAAAGLAADKNAAELLIGLLADPDVDVRREAARSLSALPGLRAAEALIAAARDQNSFVRRWVAAGLASQPGQAATEALQTLAHDPVRLVAEQAAQSLMRRGLPTPPMSPYLPPAGPGSPERVASLLTDPDATIRKDACKLAFGQTWAGAVLHPLLTDRDSEVRKAAVEAIGLAGGDLNSLIPLLADPDPDVRITTYVSLRYSPPASGVGVPAGRPTDPEEWLRKVELLAEIARRGGTPGLDLRGLLGEPDERVRAALADLFPAELAGDPAIVVRRAAAAAGAPVTAADLWAAAAAPGAPPELRAWGDALTAEEDDLLHARFSWTLPGDRPRSHHLPSPPQPRPYGQPNRG